MTDEERAALVERLRQGHEGPAADQIEADGQRIAELEAAFLKINRLSEERQDFQISSDWFAWEVEDIVRAALGETK